MGLIGALLASGAPTAAVAAPPDRIYVNARVWTADDARPRAEAFAVTGDLITHVGDRAQISALRGPKTEIVDLGGRFVAPGFNDAHLHFLVVERAVLDTATSIQEIQKLVVDYAKAHPDAPWVQGRGWGIGAFGKEAPHKRHLDAVLADRPVVLVDRDSHSVLANSKALELAGVTRASADPPNGSIVRDASGEPTGLLKEAAMTLVRSKVPRPSADEMYAALKLLLDRAASYGLTSVQNASFPAEEMPVFERLIQEKGLKLRFYWAMPFKAGLSSEELAEYKRWRDAHPGPLFKFGAVKGMLDGTIDLQTAVMFEPYTTGANGQPMWTQEDLDRTTAFYDREGFQIFLHAIGDRAIRMALDAYERAATTNGTAGRRHRIEHAELPAVVDLPRFKRLGVVASTQALFANPDQTVLENFNPLLGPERAARADAFKLFDDAGAVQAFGSDWPVMSMQVLRGIYCAVTRQTPEGTPLGGSYPQHRISVEAALRHFTRDAAFASFEDHRKGTIAPGMLADFVVLSEDITLPPAERILRTKILLTVMGGTVTHRDPGF